MVTIDTYSKKVEDDINRENGYGQDDIDGENGNRQSQHSTRPLQRRSRSSGSSQVGNWSRSLSQGSNRSRSSESSQRGDRSRCSSHGGNRSRSSSQEGNRHHSSPLEFPYSPGPQKPRSPTPFPSRERHYSSLGHSNARQSLRAINRSHPSHHQAQELNANNLASFSHGSHGPLAPPVFGSTSQSTKKQPAPKRRRKNW